MRAVRSRDTTPERMVRRWAHGWGYRFRLGRRDLPGTPDLVFPRLNAVVFVHGCFWHRHRCPAGQSTPATRQEYWLAKFAGNVARDRRHAAALRRLGWRVLIVWECQLSARKQATTAARLKRFLAAASDS